MMNPLVKLLYLKGGAEDGESLTEWAADEITTLRQRLEQAQARVAMLEEFVADAQQDAWRALDPDYVPPDVEHAMKALLHRAATITQEVDPDDIEPAAWLLRKQAEAAEEAQRLISQAEDISGMRRAAREYSESLRQQADEIEKAGGGQ